MSRCRHGARPRSRQPYVANSSRSMAFGPVSATRWTFRISSVRFERKPTLVAQVVFNRHTDVDFCLLLPCVRLAAHGSPHDPGDATIPRPLEQQYLAFLKRHVDFLVTIERLDINTRRSCRQFRRQAPA